MPPKSPVTLPITDSNEPGAFSFPLKMPVEQGDMLAHILTDLHDALAMLTRQGVLMAKHDALLEEFRPLLEAYRRTNGGTIGLLKARKAARGGP